MAIEELDIDHTWTLFLDRDGVVNRRLIDDYVKTWEEFEFLPGVLDALVVFRKVFGRIVVVTNQQGIGKGIMTEEDLSDIHNRMLNQVIEKGGRIDRIYHCPGLVKDNPKCRKPLPGMGLQAKKDFPEIDFKRSIMVGDSKSDMEFGRSLGMINVFVDHKTDKFDVNLTDYITTSLGGFSSILEDKMT